MGRSTVSPASVGMFWMICLLQDAFITHSEKACHFFYNVEHCKCVKLL